MIANAHQCRIHRISRVPPLRKAAALPPLHLDSLALATSTSKVISYILTYPLESLKLISMSEQKEKQCITFQTLYKGFMSYIPFCVFTNVVTFHVFFLIKSAILTMIQNDIASNIIASIATSIITSCYKIPYSFYLKNKVLKVPNASFQQLYESSRYTKAFVTTIAEDIPDLCIRTLCVSSMTSNSEKLTFTVISSVMTSPIEVWKSRFLCAPLLIKMKPLTLIMIILVAILRNHLYMEILLLAHRILIS